MTTESERRGKQGCTMIVVLFIAAAMAKGTWDVIVEETKPPEAVAAVEEPKAKAVPHPSEWVIDESPEVSFVVIEDQTWEAARKRSTTYQFTRNELPTKQQMRDMSHELERDQPGLDRYFVLFLLPGMVKGKGAFATCHRTPDHPDGDLVILGHHLRRDEIKAFYGE